MTHELPQMRKLLNIAKIVYLIGAGLMAFFFIWAAIWVVDREPPYELYSYEVNKPLVGGTLEVHADVRRDLSRSCSVKYTRSMYDGSGRLFWSGRETFMSADALATMDAKMRGKLEVLIPIPDDAPVGKLWMVTDMQYVCNPIHAFWPIQVITSIETEIIPNPTKQ